MTRRARGVAAMATVLGLAVALGGCGSDGGHRRTLAAGRSTQVAGDAARLGGLLQVSRHVDVPLPSGTLRLGVASHVERLTTQGDTYEPAAGASLVGVSWSFTPSPGSDAYDVLLNGERDTSLPQPRLAVVGNGSPAPVTLEIAQAHRSGGVLFGTTSPNAITVEYDGLTQTLDLRTGVLDSGPAAALVDLADATMPLGRACDQRDFPTAAVLDHGCAVRAVYRVPYLAGLGWAPRSQTWWVVDGAITGTAKMLLGTDPGTPLHSAPQGVTRVAYAVAGEKAGPVDFDFGPPIGVVAVPLD